MDLLRIARNPNYLFFALCISIIAHFAILCVLGFLPFSLKPLQEESILVDFTLMDGKQGAGGKRQGSGVRGQGKKTEAGKGEKAQGLILPEAGQGERRKAQHKKCKVKVHGKAITLP